MARRRTPRELSPDEEFHLMVALALGPQEGEYSDEELRAAWTEYRDDVMASAQNAHSVPWGFQHFELDGGTG